MRSRRRVSAATWRGQVIAKAWPRPRGKPKSQNQQAWVNRFSQMACISALADPAARDYADRTSEGTLWFWRDLVTKAMLGQFLRSEGEARVTTPTFKLTRLVSMNVLNQTDTDLPPTAEVWDTNNFWNPGSPTTHVIVRAPGLYLVGANIYWNANATQQRTLKIMVNGLQYDIIVQPNTSSSLTYQNIVTLAYFHANDQVKVQVRQNSGATVPVAMPAFWMMAISPETIVP